MNREKIIFVVDKGEAHSHWLSQFFPGGLYKVFNFLDCDECIRHLSMGPDMVMLDMDSLTSGMERDLASCIRGSRKKIPVVLI